MSSGSSYLPIKDYAIIGDSQTAALVSRSGSIDWLCLPQFDSPSFFAAILDSTRGGRFQIHPAGAYEVNRRYVGDTAVLETDFHTGGGRLRVTDLFTVAARKLNVGHLRPEHEILRVVRCLAGEVEVECIYMPRPDYGRMRARITRRDGHGFFYAHTGHLLLLRSDAPLTLAEDGSAVSGRFRLREGHRYYFSLAFDREGPAVLPILADAAERRLEETLQYWQGWTARSNYQGPYERAIVRSAITLKLLSYSESGAIVASATTSLPEQPGGVRNWDYRYCWLRDASLTLRAFQELGFSEEADSFLAWLTYATRRSLPHVHILYDVHGSARLKERVLDYLEGYEGSRPVRVGNAAREQFQLDVYGEVISACHEYCRLGGKLDRWQGKLLRLLGDAIVARWHEPDHGIWEDRAERTHHTYSKVMCWVGLDRLLRLHQSGVVRVDAPRLQRTMADIARAVEDRAFCATDGTYSNRFDESSVDATLLLLALYGYARFDDERMHRTFDRVVRELGRGPLLLRYPPEGKDGLPPGEGAFGLCGFWVVAYLARLGRLDEAEDRLAALLTYANDLGLFAEEIDPATGAALGNFPQAFTHIGVVTAALALAEARGTRPAALVGSQEIAGRFAIGARIP